jgi:GxxExxY protein
MTENLIASAVVDAAYTVHRALGPGLLESACKRVLAYELRKRNFSVEVEPVVPIVYDGLVIEHGFRADIIVEGKVILELKSVEVLAPVHAKQLLTYLRLTDLRLGLLINFGERYIKDGITRVVNRLPE